jgi:hypothetical protein
MDRAEADGRSRERIQRDLDRMIGDEAAAALWLIPRYDKTSIVCQVRANRNHSDDRRQELRESPALGRISFLCAMVPQISAEARRALRLSIRHSHGGDAARLQADDPAQYRRERREIQNVLRGMVGKQHVYREGDSYLDVFRNVRLFHDPKFDDVTEFEGMIDEEVNEVEEEEEEEEEEDDVD